MIKRQDGFSLVELLVTLAVFVLAIAAATGIFVPLVNQFKQQSKMAETNIEGIVGLELLRVDLEHAGYGLPWSFQSNIAYIEATANPFNLNDAPGNSPRSILSRDSATFGGPNSIFDGSDYLVVKSTVVAGNNTAQRWSYISRNQDGTTTLRIWGSEDLVSGTDRVIVVNPKASETALRQLVVSGAYFTTYSTPFDTNFTPLRPLETYLIYGVDTANLGMPFNRADYFIRRFNAVGNVIAPQRCAQSTGVLEKVPVDQVNGQLTNFMPLLDCVADMQVAFGVDTTNPTDGTIDCYTNNLANVLAPVDAQNVRERVKEVRIYVLAHEGQYDSFFTFGTNPIAVGENNPLNCGADPILGQNFNLTPIPNWQNYRWKVYTLVVKPENLR